MTEKRNNFVINTGVKHSLQDNAKQEGHVQDGSCSCPDYERCVNYINCSMQLLPHDMDSLSLTVLILAT